MVKALTIQLVDDTEFKLEQLDKFGSSDNGNRMNGPFQAVQVQMNIKVKDNYLSLNISHEKARELARAILSMLPPKAPKG